MLETQQFAPTNGSALRRPGAYDPQPAGFVSNDTGPTESPSKPLPDQGATRIRFPKFADEPEIYRLSLAGAGHDRKMRSWRWSIRLGGYWNGGGRFE